MKAIDSTGMKFGRLLVLETIRGDQRGSTLRCLCDCGKQVVALAYNVRNGNTKSCGCLAVEQKAARGRELAPIMGLGNVTHGHTKGYTHTRTYVSWQDARKRCFRPQNKRYPYYGGRGITMCAEWAESFEAFLRDMGECPPGYTIERKDPNGNYEPLNCVWATKAEQARNKRTTKASMEIASEIRRRYSAGESGASLARQFNMTSGNVGHIVKGTTWVQQ